MKQGIDDSTARTQRFEGLSLNAEQQGRLQIVLPPLPSLSCFGKRYSAYTSWAEHTLKSELRLEEGLEMIQVAGDQLAFAGLDVGDRAEAVGFEFENVVGIVKGFGDPG